MLYLEIVIVLLMMALNGIFAMSELALVSAKRVHLKKLADDGSAAAAQALALAADTGKFLPTVQIGITLIGIFSGVFSGATLADYLTAYLAESGLDQGQAEFLSVSLIVVLVTYLTLIIGELVPKEIALRKPERMALFVAPIIYFLSKATWPIVWILNKSSTFALWLIRAGDKPATTVTQEDVTAMIREGADHGVFGEGEREMLSGVMLLADKPIRAFIMPRGAVVSIDCDASLDEVKEIIANCSYSRFPVRDPDAENRVIGIVQTTDILRHLLSGAAFDLRQIIRQVAVFPDATNTVTIIEYLRKEPIHMAIIVDEHGAFEGIVTLTDLLSVIMGSLNEHNVESEEMLQRQDGSWLVDGSLLVEPVFEKIGLSAKQTNEFHTLAGFMLHHLRAVPKIGDSFKYKNYRFEVVDMDGYRIDKVLISKIRKEKKAV